MVLNSKYSSTIVVTLASAFFATCLYAVHIHLFGWFFMASDDSYIYLGYVRNWVERGELLTYNPGEHSAGTTGLLYYYVLSAVASLVHLLYWPTAAAGLTLTAYLTNAFLFICAGGLTAQIWHRISDTDESSSSLLETIIVWAATVSLPSFLWGWFGGLENPLSGIILLLMLERVLAKAPGWQVSIASAMLGGCRPELAPFGLLVALWAAIPANGTHNPRILISRLSASIAVFAGVTLSIYLPCWFVTGSITPSALGTRVAIPALTEPHLLWQNLAEAVRSGYFINPWVVGTPVLLVGLIAVRRTYASRVLVANASLLVLYFLMRGALGLTDFNVEDRYISFFWPLYALMAAHILQQLAIRSGWSSCSETTRRFAVLTGSLLISGCVYLGFTSANSDLTADVTEMNHMHVFPSMWMAKQLPKSARIVMEPAGAIHVFTDFYLIDVEGLTTRHKQNYLAAPSGKGDFLQQTKATHIFDYPARMPFINDKSRFFQLGLWSSPRRHSGGTIGLYAVRPMNLKDSSTVQK